ncbi:helix-turn-helix domain-containing protein [Saccharomonospora halophila]|uniref:helix-turn-helix domain-containing protein n=1 Tax=Saccharomonospora halophila TaxID=129922 RepID=UPI000A006CA3|nr:helix-turn-helix transcriptional regulator [Saccharomonospora halophila]
MSDLGANLRAAREEAGVSLSAMARRTHYSKPLLGLLETGKRAINPDHVTAYARALNVSVETLYGPADDPLRIAHEWLVAPTPVEIRLGSGRRVGSALADRLAERVIELRHLDDVIGGRDLLPVVRKELASAEHLVNEAAYTERTGRRLLTLVGELAQLAGWVSGDAGHYTEAKRLYLSGVSAAHEAGDPALVGQLLSCLSYQIANVGDPADALLLARSAITGVEGRTTPLVRALLLERVAWASARARDRDGTRRALDAVDEAYERRSAGAAEPEWVYWLDRNEIDVMAGRCLIELGDPVTAEPLLSGALAAYTPEHAREVALYRTWLAESCARAGVFDAARTTLDHARGAATEASSTRLDTRIAEVERLVR